MNQHQLLFSSMHLPQLTRVKLHHMLVTLNRERMSYACRCMRECVCVRCFACALHTCVFVLPLFHIDKQEWGTHGQSEADSDPSGSPENIWGHHLLLSHTSPALLIASCSFCDLWRAEFKSCTTVWNHLNNSLLSENGEAFFDALFLKLCNDPNEPKKNALRLR